MKQKLSTRNSPLIIGRKGFTLVEIAMVLVVIGILLSIGAGLVGVLTKKAKFNESRDIVKAAKEAVLGFAVKYKRLPTTLEFSDIVKSTDAWTNTLFYYPDPNLTAGDACCSASAGFAITDLGVNKPNSAFIVLSMGENGTNNTGTAPAFTINEYGTADYDDLVQYVSISELKDSVLSCQALEIATTTLQEAEEDTPYFTKVVGKGGCNPTFSLTAGALPTGLSLAADGVISGTVNESATTAGTLGACSNSDTFTVRMSATGLNPTDKQLTIITKPQTLKITNASDLPTGAVSGAYSSTLYGAGGRTGYTWSISSGSLPPGLALAGATGVISGTPTSAGIYSFVVSLADPCSTTSKAFTITITSGAAPGSPTCTLSAAPNPITSGQTTTLTWTITNGPATGTWNIAPGGTCPSPVPSGSGSSCTTAAIASTTTFILTVTNANGTNVCSTTVSTTCPALSNTTSNPMTGGTVGVIYASNITYSGGQGSVSCSIAGGSLPPGLSLVGCTIGGTPSTAGTYNFTTRVTDSCSTPQTSDMATSITIAASCTALLNTTPTPMSAGTAYTAYSQNITYSGGVAPVSCSITAGSLPPGLSRVGCTISGTPTTTGTYNFTTSVTDSCATPQTSNKATSITINPDSCYAGGIEVRNNMGAADRGYKINGGACNSWANNGFMTVLPGNSYEVFLENTCVTSCATTNYGGQKPFDTDNDCKTKMIGGCLFDDR